MKTLRVRHETRYRYTGPVKLGRHRLMLRPRDSHDLRLIGATLTLDPPATVTWFHDVFGNSIAHADFTGGTDHLTIVSELTLERYPSPPLEILIDPSGENYPFVYGSDDRIDLGTLTDRHYPDTGAVRAYIDQVAPERPIRTLGLLTRLSESIKRDHVYQTRWAEGTQTPEDTRRNGGSCRDYALLFMECARELGLAARFVTGYLFDAIADSQNLVGTGATHAWAEVFLPGAGWVEFDPTNGLVGSEQLLRVAVVRDPRQASPVSGTYVGGPSELLVNVTVNETAPDQLAA